VNRRTIARLLPLAAVAAVLLAPAADAKPAKRGPYPPARLWYRVSVEFDGTARITDEKSRQPSDFGLRWKLESRHAVRLTLMCVNPKLGLHNPFEWKERIRGRKRRVGGCPPSPRTHGRTNLRETVRFAAVADGQITSWEHNDPIDFQDGCPGRTDHYELVQSQPLTGTVSSSSSATEGVHLTVDAVNPFGAYTVTAPGIHCEPPAPRRPFDKPPVSLTGVPFSPNSVFGGETWVGHKLASEQLALRFPPKKFGRGFSVTRRLTQNEDTSRTRALAPAGPYFLDPFGAKDYRYTIRFEACPARGHDVNSC
jgi:hypothetical protein